MAAALGVQGLKVWGCLGFWDVLSGVDVFFVLGFVDFETPKAKSSSLCPCSKPKPRKPEPFNYSLQPSPRTLNPKPLNPEP